MSARRGQVVLTRLAQLKHLPDITRDFMLPVMQRQARLLISSSGKVKGLVQATPPYMLSESGDGASKAFARGKQAVSRDIRRVYGTPGDLFARIKDRKSVV